MAEALRFHLDEHVPKAVATGLRSHGIDVTTAADAGLLSAKDHEHLAFAASQSRILVTHDRHFLRHAASGVVHAGVAYCHQEKYAVGAMLQALLLLHACSTADEMWNRVEYL
jgi:uncharacterized protein with PIN domain